MSGFTDATELAVLNALTGKAALPAGTLYVGLSSTPPADAGTGATEPTGGGYARVAAPAASWAAATGTAPAYTDNSAVLAFAPASADWAAGAPLTHAVVFNAATGGSPVMAGPLVQAKPVLTGDTAQFLAGGLRIQLGDPGDTY